MKIRWQRLAARDAITAVEFARTVDADAANRLAVRLAGAVQQLGQFPESGKPGRRANTRELYLTGTSYLIVYRATLSEVVIVRLLHTSRGSSR